MRRRVTRALLQFGSHRLRTSRLSHQPVRTTYRLPPTACMPRRAHLLPAFRPLPAATVSLGCLLSSCNYCNKLCSRFDRPPKESNYLHTGTTEGRWLTPTVRRSPGHLEYVSLFLKSVLCVRHGVLALAAWGSLWFRVTLCVYSVDLWSQVVLTPVVNAEKPDHPPLPFGHQL